MRLMRRNAREFWYAPFERREPEIILDEYGNQILSGNQEAVYGSPVACMGNVSPEGGEVSRRIFGTERPYSRVILVHRDLPEIDEDAVLWIERKPVVRINGEDVRNPHDYIVVGVARSLNHTAIAVRRVNVHE